MGRAARRAAGFAVFGADETVRKLVPAPEDAHWAEPERDCTSQRWRHPPRSTRTSRRSSVGSHSELGKVRRSAAFRERPVTTSAGTVGLSSGPVVVNALRGLP